MFQLFAVLMALISLKAFAAEGQLKSVAPSHRAAAKAKKVDSDTKESDDDEDDNDDDDDSASTSAVDSTSADDSTDEDNSDDAESQGQALKGNVTLASDYILRGLSQTDHQPALQGGFDWESPIGLYFGTWGSNVHFPELASSLELDFYGGYTYAFSNGLKASAGLSYFSFWENTGRNSWDIPLKAEWDPLSLELDISPDWEGTGEAALYILAGWEQKLYWDFKGGVFVGYSFLPSKFDASNYFDSKISISREFFGVEWGVTGVLVKNQIINDAVGGSHVIFSITKSL